jgi:hypothetical protein
VPRTFVPFGELKPDENPHLSDGLITAEGCYAVANGYKPINQFHEIADALSGTFKGGASFIDSNGTIRFLAGNATNLYYLNGETWESEIGSRTVSDRWRFTQFGNEIICCDGAAPVAFNLTAATAAALAGSPPTADLCATVRDFVVLGRVDGDNNVVAWCGQGDAHEWTPGTNQAGLQPLYAGGKVMGLSSGEECVILQRFAVKIMRYTGDATDPWQFDEVSTNYGCMAEGSVVQVDKSVFYYSDRGFAVYDGGTVRPIGNERVNETFRALYSNREIQNMWSALDPRRNVVMWFLPGRAWIYNWAINRFTVAPWDIQAGFGSFSAAISIDALDALYPGGIDLLPYSLDDPRFQGGEPRLTVVKNTGEFGVLTGDPMAAEFEVPFMEYAGERVARIRRVRPVGDFPASGLTLTASARKRLGSSSEIDNYTTVNSGGEFPVRVASRHVKLKLSIEEGASWDYAQGFDVEWNVGGRG